MAEEEEFEESSNEEISEDELSTGEDSEDDENSEREESETEEKEESEEEIPGIKKNAYQENFSSDIVHERDRLKELLDQTDFSPSEGSSLRTENLERIAISSPAFSQSGSRARNNEEPYQSFSNAYSESDAYHTSIYQERSYEEYRYWGQNDQDLSPGPDSSGGTGNSTTYDPKPVENFEQQNRTDLAIGAEKERKESREKYRLR
ncbi:MAG: hypothetical protein ABEI74_00555 [Candidatus Pacearchaeota archaeon]